MTFFFDYRESDSPFVETIYRTQTGDSISSFTSRAESRWEMVVTRHEGKLTLSIRGPETKASTAPVPHNAEMFGIVFKLGTFMPHMPTSKLVDGGINLPESVGRAFWLYGAAWEFPNFENADTFVNRLVHDNMLVREPVVEAALQGQLRLDDLSLRSVQRRFLRATGLTHGTVYQIKRAQQALSLLQQGTSIPDTIDMLGYADQPHLTRAMRKFIGETPAQILRAGKFEPLLATDS